MEENMLLQKAELAKEKSYSPYSKFRVGAAVLTGSGEIYTGANIENVSFGATCCAERVAVYNAVASGESEIKAVAIASDSNNYIMPCGVCRQVLAEFGDDDMNIYCSSMNGEYKAYKLGQLLPGAFRSLEK